MTNSILDSIKGALGVTSTYTAFDQEIIMHINSVFGDLSQLGLGPDAGYSITGSSEVWADYLPTNEKLLNGVKSYMFLRVKLLFDPPDVGFVLTALKEQVDKAEWRLNVEREEIDHPLPTTPPVVLDSVDVLFDGYLI